MEEKKCDTKKEDKVTESNGDKTVQPELHKVSLDTKKDNDEAVGQQQKLAEQKQAEVQVVTGMVDEEVENRDEDALQSEDEVCSWQHHCQNLASTIPTLTPYPPPLYTAGFQQCLCEASQSLSSCSS